MSDTGERRRTARVIVSSRCELGLGLTRSVRLVDISMAGALMRASEESAVGERGELRTMLGDAPFVVHVEIRRVSVDSPERGWAGGFKVGVAFVSLDPQNRRCLERFLRQPASS
jgi:hypothetical protein